MAETVLGYEEFILRVGTGLLLGSLVGLERERAQLGGKSKKSSSIPGFRTMGFLGLYGSLTGYIGVFLSGLSATAMMLFMGLSFAVVSILVILFAYARMVKFSSMGFTTYIVMFLTFTAGLMTGMGLVLEGASTGVIAGLLLALKEPIVRVTRAIRYDELIALMEVAAVVLVLGPTVYYLRGYVGFIDVFQAYLFFTAIIALSFASYIAARVWGARGFVTSIVLGSLVNSEAVVASIASRRGMERGILLHSMLATLGVMQVRIAALALYALAISGYYSGLGGLAIGEPPAVILLLGIASLAVARISTIRLRRIEADMVAPQTPLDWGVAVRGALAFLALTLILNYLSSVVEGYSGQLAVVGLSMVGGFISANATLLSLASLAPSIGPEALAAGALATALGASLNKIIYARAIGARGEALEVTAKASIVMSLIPAALLAAYYIIPG